MARREEQHQSAGGLQASWSPRTLGSVLMLLTVSGCTAILGIDQDYTLGAGGGVSSTSPGGTGPAGGGGGGTTLLMDYDDGIADNGVHDDGINGGGFDDTSASTTSTSFTDHTVWFHYGANQDQEAALASLDNNGAKTDGSLRSAVLTDARIFHASTAATGYVFASGDTHSIQFVWRDGSNWDDATGTATLAIGYYDDEGSAGFDPMADTFTVVSSLTTATSTQDSTWEDGGGTFPDVAPSAAAGKGLYVRITASDQFARVDNITLTAYSGAPP